MIIDKYGLLNSRSDGGDSCHKMYTLHIRLELRKRLIMPIKLIGVASPEKLQELLEPNKDGIYIRNPDPERWYSDPRNFSRDQSTPPICYHAIMSNSKNPEVADNARKLQARFLKQYLKRYMFAQNIYPNWVDPRTEKVEKKTPDFLNFDLWGIFARSFIRTKYAPIALPFIIFGDIFQVLSALFKCFAPINKDGTLEFRLPGPDDVDDDNINNVIMASQYVFQTPLSWLARKLYKKFRPQNLGNTELKDKNNIMGALIWYHKDDNPEVAEIARPLVERY